MRKFRPIVLAFLIGIVAISASAQSPGDVSTLEPRPTSQPQGAHSDLLIYNVWVRPTAATPPAADSTEEAPSGALTVTGGYMTITNQTAVDYTLVSATTTINGMSEIHESSMNGGMMQMRPIEGGLLIPAGTTVALEPGGLHVMLMDMTENIYPGEAVVMNVVLTGADDTRIERTVAALVTDFPPESGALIVADAFATIAPIPFQQPIPDVTATPQIAEDAIALYMKLINTSSPTLNITGARIDFAGSVEIRESYFLDGQIASRSIPFAPVPVLARLLLQPNGYHLYATDLTSLPEPGAAFTATLTFDDGVEIPVAFLMQ